MGVRVPSNGVPDPPGLSRLLTDPGTWWLRRPADPSGRHDLLSVSIPERIEPHLLHPSHDDSEARGVGANPSHPRPPRGKPGGVLGRSLQPCSPVIHPRDLNLPPSKAVFVGSAGPHDATPKAGSRTLSFFSQGVVVAPSGTSSCSRYFHNAISNFLANATIPTFRARALPAPKRRSYHRLNALCGW